MREIIVDIETAPHPCAGDFIPAPDLSAITAAKNLKDPVKVAADLEQRREAAQAEYVNSLQRAALDWNLSRIVAIAWIDSDGVTTSTACPDEWSERVWLKNFWAVAYGMRLVGFCSRTFDLPTIIQRSRLLKVPHPFVSLNRYGRGDVVDLRDILTFDDARYEAIMSRSLKAFAKRFGIPVNDTIDGSQIPALVEAGNWDAIRAHVVSDVRLTQALNALVRPVYQPSEREAEGVL